MKVAIITITSGENYGNRLQNYAMQEVLKSHGHAVRTIRKESFKFTTSYRAKLFIKSALRKKTEKDKRIESFKKFDDKYIDYEKKILKSDAYNKKIEAKYDCFVCGSDQIWNVNYGTNTDAFFLSFVKNKRKVAISASFGIENIPKEQVQRVTDNLRKVDAISVRESEGKSIVEKLSQTECEVLIDPTLMIDGTSWRNISERPFKLEEKFVLTYILGETSEEINEEINRFAHDKKLKIINLGGDIFEENDCSIKEFIVSPMGFIWLIDNCEAVFTDSFHALVFSILLQKKYRCYFRDGVKGTTNSRITNLLSKLGLEGKYSILNEDINWGDVYKKLEYEREKFNSFIKNNIKKD